MQLKQLHLAVLQRHTEEKKKTGTKELEERTIRIILTKKHQYIRTKSGRKRVPTRAISTESMTGSQHDHWQEMNQESSFKDKQYS